MLNGGFYPTPPEVIDKMLEPLVKKFENGTYRQRYLKYDQILEPSAGKGDILDRLANRYDVRKDQMYAVEVEPELQMVLSGKGYRVIDSDFLSYDGHYLFDLIVMNPPFDRGVDHLLKAWEVLHAGDIVCLLNANTILKDNSEKRKLLLRLIGLHGRYEIVGQVFKNAERPTDVTCVIVWLHKDAPASTVNFDGEGIEFDAPATEAALSENPLAHPNIIQSLVAQYNHAVNLLVEMHGVQSKYRFYTQIVDEYSSLMKEQGHHSLNEKIDDLKAAFWQYVFRKTQIGSKTTSNFRRKFDEFATQTSRMAFSEANILMVLEMFFQNRDQIIQECIVEVFDKATAYHEKNIIHNEGWKTNKSWKIAPKIIMPYGIKYEPKWQYAPWGEHYHGTAYDFYGDMDKALCYVAGRDVEDIRTTRMAIAYRMKELNANPNADHTSPFYSAFFEIRIFKKGTVHLIFRDKGLLAQFNQAAAKGKNWIGGGY